MKLITFGISKEEPWNERSPMQVRAVIITDSGVKMDVIFTPDLGAIAIQGVSEMVKIALVKATAPIARGEKMADPTKQLTLSSSEA